MLLFDFANAELFSGIEPYAFKFKFKFQKKILLLSLNQLNQVLLGQIAGEKDEAHHLECITIQTLEERQSMRSCKR